VNAPLLTALVISALVLAWKLLTLNRKRHRSPSAIIACMDNGNPRNLIQRISEDGPSGWRISRERDAEFWAYIGRYRGLARIHTNANCCAELCRALRLANDEDISFIYQRALTISALTVLSLCESLLRFILPALPHVCAMLSVSLYIELRIRTENLCNQYNPDVAIGLKAII
jgi:hypothetical protein